MVKQLNGQAAASVPRCGPGVVLLAAAAHVLRNAGVERAIGAPEHIDEPAVARRFPPWPAVLSSHPDKILGASLPGCPVGVLKQSLIVRLGPEESDEALKEPHVSEFNITGRSMKGWVLVAPETSSRRTDESPCITCQTAELSHANEYHFD
jgi:hypothetical protein